MKKLILALALCAAASPAVAQLSEANHAKAMQRPITLTVKQMLQIQSMSSEICRMAYAGHYDPEKSADELERRAKQIGLDSDQRIYLMSLCLSWLDGYYERDASK